ncbi:MAG: histidine kinase [uncultured Sulfurovum sp.]|uniref:histidine kinase n=1 Tax=uncultured Sulfurovum sp. TaxID=269237 RepID=A0A6S6SAF4_9BACT|nr:MAG: histidine kinase [uncultured Sulfurovum sp.]
MFEGWGTVLTFDTNKFAKKYAIKYTLILAIILIVPLIFYLSLLLQIDKAKTELALERQLHRVMLSMNEYDNSGVYTFPRYKEFDTALYDKRYKRIFSTLDFEPSSYASGFYRDKHHYYIIHALNEGHYFEAKYLLVSTVHRANEIYLLALLAILLILITLFIFSLRLFQNFSRPFEQINDKLDTFIKDSMHEINTPLSIININSELFANKYGDNKYLQRIKSATKTLATIYDDMDYLIKQGRVEHKVQNINLSDFIQNRVDYFKGIANLKQIHIETKITSSLSYQFSKTKLQRIVDNTISNAIKYSYDDNKIKVKVYVENQQIIFSVEDFGIGIEKVEQIFSRYYRENQTKGGFGIGLNIVKDIIEEEKIILEVKSELSEGTIFIYTFPFQ